VVKDYEEEDRRTVVVLRLPVTGVIKESPYVSEGEVGTATLCLNIEVGGYFDSAEEFVEEAASRLQNALDVQVANWARKD
jgi:hypothetical protein